MNQEKTILITGCNGLLGQKLISCFAGEDNILHGIDLQKNCFFSKPVNFTYYNLDLIHKDKVLKLAEKIHPDIILNAAAMTNVDACEIEQEKCRQINLETVKHLVEAAGNINASLVHISTDYVFDGVNGPYCEDDIPNPQSCYARTKLESEKVVLQSGLKAVVLRTVVLFGHGNNLKTDFIAWVINQLRADKKIKIVTDQVSNVTLADDLANAVKRVIDLEKWGLYHAAGSEILSRYDFTLRIAELFNLDKTLINPILTCELQQAAARPLTGGGLIVEKAERLLNYKFRNVKESLSEYQRQEQMYQQEN